MVSKTPQSSLLSIEGNRLYLGRMDLPRAPRQSRGPQNTPDSTAAVKEAASLLGRRSAQKMTSDQRTDRARKGGKARWSKTQQPQKENRADATAR